MTSLKVGDRARELAEEWHLCASDIDLAAPEIAALLELLVEARKELVHYSTCAHVAIYDDECSCGVGPLIEKIDKLVEGEMSLEMKYFVLKPRGDTPHAKASREAMIAYANAIADHDPQLAQALYDWSVTCESAASNPTEQR